MITNTSSSTTVIACTSTVRKTTATLFGPVVLLLLSSHCLAGPVNGGFETGDLAGWDAIGVAFIETADLGATPSEASYQTVLTNESDSLLSPEPAAAVSFDELEAFLGLAPFTLDGLVNGLVIDGSAIKQTFTASVGDKLTFDWSFLTLEDPADALAFGTNDFAFFTLSGAATLTGKLADTQFVPLVQSFTPFELETTYHLAEIILTATGEYTLGIGVVNVDDGIVDSGLLIDNVQLHPVPEPSGYHYLIIGACFVGSYLYLRSWRVAHHRISRRRPNLLQRALRCEPLEARECLTIVIDQGAYDDTLIDLVGEPALTLIARAGAFDQGRRPFDFDSSTVTGADAAGNVSAQVLDLSSQITATTTMTETPTGFRGLLSYSYAISDPRSDNSIFDSVILDYEMQFKATFSDPIELVDWTVTTTYTQSREQTGGYKIGGATAWLDTHPSNGKGASGPPLPPHTNQVGGWLRSWAADVGDIHITFDDYPDYDATQVTGSGSVEWELVFFNARAPLTNSSCPFYAQPRMG